ncbi:Serine/threonine-protein kinase RAD53 [Cladorrhinum sp. PSN332]|nr:Serine/threonine-protein kinase RAD53 [Cladorrhinum sp. PSN332]
MPVVGPSSEVVKYLELKTRRDIAKGWTEHYFYQRGTSARNRKIILSERWRRIRKLGSGAFGSVWLEKCDRMVRKDAPSVRAVKEIKFNSGIDFTRELEAIAKFSNNEYLPSFVRCFGWFQINDSIFITMEHIEHGDLRKHLDDPMPEREANLIIGQLVEGLGHMHRNKFVHRDLKPENILVVEKGPGWLVQISDFGISRKLEDGRTIGTAQQGTLGYIAPEVMGFIDGKGLSFAADMWSLGAVLFRMLTRKTFLTYGDEHRKFVNGEKVVPVEELRRAGLSDSGLDFLQKLLVASPEARLTVDEATRHRWRIHNPAQSWTNSV